MTSIICLRNGLRSVVNMGVRSLKYNRTIPTRAFSTDLDSTVIVTNSCAKRIKYLQHKEKNPALKLRLEVNNGGCSGFQYEFKLSDSPPEEDDLVFSKNGTDLVIDSTSFEFMKGATVDYVEEMMHSKFAVLNNPQSESACGCGTSFAVKNFAKNPARD